MNKIILILFLLLLNLTTTAQSYLRGEVKDEQNNPLANARILLHSTGYVYHSGSSGGFGIITSGKTDSVTISLAGYQTVAMSVNTAEFLTVQLRLLRSTANLQKNKLLSFTRDLEFTGQSHWASRGESYSALVENEFVETRKYPETGFAIRIDKASYSNIRRFLNMDTHVPSDAVRIEEVLNYFDFGYEAPRSDSMFSLTSQLTDCPWNALNRLLFLRICAKKVEPDKVPPSNLVFLVDVSGSMDMPNRLPLLKSAFKLLIENLREQDTISIVIYGSAVGVFLVPTSGKEKVKIREAIEGLHPGGATPGESGILTAYQLAKNQFIPGGNNRVILATDGDFNVGQHSEDQLEQLITSHQETGIYLTCLGVGMGNYKDSKLEVLAKKGNGNFAYLDNEEEAEKVLVREFTQTMFSVADDASLNIHFNDSQVGEYRLIGYDNKMKALTDSVRDVEGGEVGSGHTSMVVFEIVPATVDAPDDGNSPIRNDQLEKKHLGTHQLQAGSMLASVQINYREPTDSLQKQSIFYIPDSYRPFKQISPDYRFAASVAMFGSLLKNSPHTKKLAWNELIDLAGKSHDANDPIQRQFLVLLEKAKKIYHKKKRKGIFW